MFAIFFSSHYSLLIPPEYGQSENMFYSLLVAMTQLNNCAGVNPKPLLFVPLNSLPSKAQYEQQLIFKQSPANPYHGPPLHLRIWAIGLYTMVISMWKSLLYPPIFSIHILPSTFTLVNSAQLIVCSEFCLKSEQAISITLSQSHLGAWTPAASSY